MLLQERGQQDYHACFIYLSLILTGAGMATALWA